jgi:hypothetical protein
MGRLFKEAFLIGCCRQVIRKDTEKAVAAGQLSVTDAQLLLRNFARCLDSYTYLRR